jgi:hypothetical protein
VYTTFLYAHIRLTHPLNGYPILPLLISPRNSPAAVAHLLTQTKAKYLWIGGGVVATLANDALAQMDNESDRPLLLPFPSFRDLYQCENASSLDEKNDETIVDMNTSALILHSSGNFYESFDEYLAEQLRRFDCLSQTNCQDALCSETRATDSS